ARRCRIAPPRSHPMTRLPAGRVSVLTAAALLAGAALRAEDWPGWRGPTGMGHTRENGLPVTWGGKEKANILWQAPLIDGAAKVSLDHNQSSPVVVGDSVFVTLSYWPEGTTNKSYSEHHVICFRKSDGKRLWDTQVKPGGWLL